jgi:DNA-binding NarL/FixJ family response regulator
MVITKQRLIVEYELKEEEQIHIMAELQRMIIGKLAGKDGRAAVTISWERKVEAGMEQGQLEYSMSTPPVAAAGFTSRRLSGRELEISRMLCANHSVRKIAGQLHISENTVKKHIQNIKRTLGIRENGLDFVYELRSRMNNLGTA